VVKVLSVSDQIDPRIYSNSLAERHGEVDFVISCGDLSYKYLEYILTVLNRPLYFVHGNHDPLEEIGLNDLRSYPLGADNLHGRILREHGLLLAGIEGSIQYNRKTPYQYTQGSMWLKVFALVPGLILNKIRFGRYLDIFITHAPPRGIHEGEDWTHQGIHAFRWLIDTFQPGFHFHGHIHHYRPDDIKETRTGKTLVINTYRSRLTELS
jgi:Icc-related predicted phosphoesterase